MNLALWLQRAAQTGPTRPALFNGFELVADYAAFFNRAACLAGWLRAQGVTADDRVGLFMKNQPDYLVALFGCWIAGVAVVPINAKLHGKEAAWILQDAGAKLCLASPVLADAITDGNLRVVGLNSVDFTADPFPVSDRQADDLAWLFYTSGTTGRPKGVMITHRMLATMTFSYFTDVEPVTPDDATLYAAPMSHGAGLYCLMHVLKAARHIHPPSGGFDEAEIFELARYHDRVQMFAAPTMVKRLVQVGKARGEDGAGLRSIIYAGGPMYQADVIEAVELFGPKFIQIYGQGECPMGISALSRHDVADRHHPRWSERLASVGRAQSPIELAIGDEAGNLLPIGRVGEVMARGDTVMSGYWQAPEATAKTLVNGWLRTGDMGSLDADGYLTLRDRSKDLIISGGTNIYPREVEEVLLTHSGVAEVSVIGRPDPEWGEDVVAFVVRTDEVAVTPAELDAHCQSQIARFKRPKDYFFVPELPKNNYGKVLKTELRSRFMGET